YNLRCLRESLKSGNAARLVSYHAMLEDPLATVSQVIGAGTLDSLDFEMRHQIRSFVTSTDNHHAKAGTSLINAPDIATAVKDRWALLEEWNALEAVARTEAVAKLSEVFNEAMLFAGKLIRLPAAVEAAVAPQAERKVQGSAVPREGGAVADRK